MTEDSDHMTEQDWIAVERMLETLPIMDDSANDPDVSLEVMDFLFKL